MGRWNSASGLERLCSGGGMESGFGQLRSRIPSRSLGNRGEGKGSQKLEERVRWSRGDRGEE